MPPRTLAQPAPHPQTPHHPRRLQQIQEHAHLTPRSPLAISPSRFRPDDQTSTIEQELQAIIDTEDLLTQNHLIALIENSGKIFHILCTNQKYQLPVGLIWNIFNKIWRDTFNGNTNPPEEILFNTIRCLSLYASLLLITEQNPEQCRSTIQNFIETIRTFDTIASDLKHETNTLLEILTIILSEHRDSRREFINNLLQAFGQLISRQNPSALLSCCLKAENARRAERQAQTTLSLIYLRFSITHAVEDIQTTQHILTQLQDNHDIIFIHKSSNNLTNRHIVAHMLYKLATFTERPEIQNLILYGNENTYQEPGTTVERGYFSFLSLIRREQNKGGKHTGNLEDFYSKHEPFLSSLNKIAQSDWDRLRPQAKQLLHEYILALASRLKDDEITNFYGLLYYKLGIQFALLLSEEKITTQPTRQPIASTLSPPATPDAPIGQTIGLSPITHGSPFQNSPQTPEERQSIALSPFIPLSPFQNSSQALEEGLRITALIDRSAELEITNKTLLAQYQEQLIKSDDLKKYQHYDQQYAPPSRLKKIAFWSSCMILTIATASPLIAGILVSSTSLMWMSAVFATVSLMSLGIGWLLSTTTLPTLEKTPVTNLKRIPTLSELLQKYKIDDIPRLLEEEKQRLQEKQDELSDKLVDITSIVQRYEGSLKNSHLNRKWKLGIGITLGVLSTAALLVIGPVSLGLSFLGLNILGLTKVGFGILLAAKFLPFTVTYMAFNKPLPSLSAGQAINIDDLETRATLEDKEIEEVLQQSVTSVTQITATLDQTNTNPQILFPEEAQPSAAENHIIDETYPCLAVSSQSTPSPST